VPSISTSRWSPPQGLSTTTKESKKELHSKFSDGGSYQQEESETLPIKVFGNGVTSIKCIWQRPIDMEAAKCLVGCQLVISVGGSKMMIKFASQCSGANMHQGQVLPWYGGHNLGRNCTVLLKMHTIKCRTFSEAGVDGQPTLCFWKYILIVMHLNFNFLLAGAGNFLDDNILQYNSPITEFSKYYKTILLQLSFECISIDGIYKQEISLYCPIGQYWLSVISHTDQTLVPFENFRSWQCKQKRSVIIYTKEPNCKWHQCQVRIMITIFADWYIN